MIRSWVMLVALAGSTAFAQDRVTPVPPIPLGDTLLTLPTSHIPAAGTWETKFSHRFNQSIDEGEAFRSFFGLDSGANVGIGLSFTPVSRFQLSILRSNVLDTYELAGKYVLFQQARAIPFSAALRGGVDVRTEESLDDRTSFFGQAILSRQFGRRVALFVQPTFVTDAGRAAGAETSVALFESVFNVPVGVAFVMTPRLSLIAELIPPNHDLPDDLSADLGWAVGVKSVVGGHYFEILLTNSNGTTVDQYATSTYQGVPFRSGDLRLGFNIERRFGKARL
ncbi:MAG TPA: DUF5777 family beta-barrel protein [Thermoanaerobaculia bacterium]|nr:DUF5777 family beta-barrel protein [Thermoanaerobaculia bacterium]